VAKLATAEFVLLVEKAAHMKDRGVRVGRAVGRTLGLNLGGMTGTSCPREIENIGWFVLVVGGEITANLLPVDEPMTSNEGIGPVRNIHERP